MSPPRPRASLRPLADLIRPAVGEAMQAQGFAAADVLSRWPEIAGPRLAARSMPIRILRAPRAKGMTRPGMTRPGMTRAGASDAGLPDAGPAPATLVLKVESAFAHEVEMASAQILERVNAVFGWRVVGRLRLRQGSVDRPRSRAAVAPAALEPGRQRQLQASVQGIEDEGLRAALERLGQAVLGERR